MEWHSPTNLIRFVLLFCCIAIIVESVPHFQSLFSSQQESLTTPSGTKTETKHSETNLVNPVDPPLANSATKSGDPPVGNSDDLPEADSEKKSVDPTKANSETKSADPPEANTDDLTDADSAKTPVDRAEANSDAISGEPSLASKVKKSGDSAAADSATAPQGIANASKEQKSGDTAATNSAVTNANSASSKLYSALLVVLAVLIVLICIVAMFWVPDPKLQIIEANDLKSQAEEKLARANEAMNTARTDRETAEIARSEASFQLEESKRLQAQLKVDKDEHQENLENFAKVEANLTEKSKKIAEEKDDLKKKQEKLEGNLRLVQQSEAIIAEVTKAKAESELVAKNARSEKEKAANESAKLAGLIQENALQLKQIEAEKKQLAEEKKVVDEKILESNAILKQTKTESQNAAADRLESENLRKEAKMLDDSVSKTQAAILEFRSRYWPTWLTDSQLSPTTSQLEDLSRNGNPNAAFLMSYLQVLQSIESHPDFNREFNYLWPTVREIGRFLVMTHTANVESPEAIVQSLTDWAKALNQSAKGRFRLFVPSIGGAFDPSQMESKSGSILSVSKVHNWAVINAKSITQTKAEVS